MNEAPVKNELNRQFNRQPLEAIVTDLTYVNIKGVWHYVCLILDLFNREMVGCAVGKHKDAELVKRAISTIPYNCAQIQYFHTDRGNEFDNKTVDNFLKAFGITRSLSEKGTPYDNAVAESTYKSFKLSLFIKNHFRLCESLKLKRLISLIGGILSEFMEH